MPTAVQTAVAEAESNLADVHDEISGALGRDAIQFIEQAVALGWRILVSKNGTNVTLVPMEKYDYPNNRIHLSTRNKDANALSKFHRKMVRYSYITELREAGELDVTTEQVIQGIRSKGMGAYLASLGAAEIAGVIGSDRDRVEKLPDEPKKARFQKPEIVPTPADVAKQQKAARHIISERPAIMHAGLRRGYPSETTIERKWSDGTVDYQCAAPNCGETSTNRRAFGNAHWSMHVRKGEVQPAKQGNYIEDPTHTDVRSYTVNYRLTKLQSLLAGIDLTKITAEDLAEQIDQALKRDGGDVGDEPLSAEQIVDRIRRIVDRGHYMEQEDKIGELSRQLNEITEYADQQIADAEERANAEHARANALEETLVTLKDLLAEVGVKTS